MRGSVLCPSGSLVTLNAEAQRQRRQWRRQGQQQQQQKTSCCRWNGRQHRVHPVALASSRCVAAGNWKDLPFIRQLAATAAGLTAAAAILTGDVAQAAYSLKTPIIPLPSTGEIALRRAVPPSSVESSQASLALDEVAFLLRIPQRKPWGRMLQFASDAQDSLSKEESANAAREGAISAIDKLQAALEQVYIDLQKDIPATNSEQEDAQLAAKFLADARTNLAAMTLNQPRGLPFLIPKEYRAYPYLTGRATLAVEFESRDNDNGKGELEPLLIEVDGFNAPLSAGRIVFLASQGAYDGAKLDITGLGGQSIFVDTAAAPKDPLPPLPFEATLTDSFEPSFRIPLDIGYGEVAKLPLSVFGAVAMAHDADDANSALSKFFLYRYDRQRDGGLGGFTFEEGNYAVFGYVVAGKETLRGLSDNAIIRNITVLSGLDKLVIPDSIDKSAV